MAFKFEVICEDKHLARILRLLAGSGVQIGPPIPIVEAPPAGNGSLNAAGGAVWDGIIKDRLTEIRSRQAGVYLKSAGLSAQSATYAMNNLMKHRYVKRTSTPGLYKILEMSK